MEITNAVENEVLVVRLTGALDTASSQQLRQAACFQPVTSHAVLDLSQLNYIDSAGLGAIVGVIKAHKQSGKKIALADAQTVVMKIFTMTMIDRIVPVKATTQEAIEFLKQP